MDQFSGGILYLVAIFAIFYFFIIRPQSKRQKERQKMLDALKKGEDVVTIGGVHGKVMGFKNNEKIVVLKVNDNINLDVDRTAISHFKGKGEDSKAN